MPVRIFPPPVDDPSRVVIADSPLNDAFSRLRISSPQLRLSALFDLDKRPLIWAESTTGTGVATHRPNERLVDMTVSASGDQVVRQTKEYFTYRAAQGQLILATFAMDTADANVRERVGYFDASDGIFLERQGSTVAVVIRTSTSGSPVDTRTVPQANWNIDTLDGSGGAGNPSGLALDLTSTQILVLDFQWLGVGRVRIGFDIGGEIVYVHQFLSANVGLGTVYMRTPKLPVRYEITATGVPGAARDLRQICAAVIREGGIDDPSTGQEGRSNASVNVGTAWETVLGLRLTSAGLRATLRLLSSELLNLDASTPAEFMVILNPTYGGTPTWEAPDPDSAAEIARFNAAITVNAAGDPSAGHVYPLGGFAGASAGSRGSATARQIGETVPCVADIAGTRDEVWLCARALSGTIDVRGRLAWIEER